MICARWAEQGNPEAQFLLALFIAVANGVLQNDNQAVDWFQRAADQGYVRAPLSALAFFLLGADGGPSGLFEGLLLV